MEIDRLFLPQKFFHGAFSIGLLVGGAHHDLLDADEQQQQQAGGDLAPPGKQIALEGDQRGNDGFQHHAEERAHHVSHAAGEQRAADDRAGDHVQLPALKGQVPAALHIQRVGNAGQHGAQAVQAVHQHLGAAYGQAHELGALLIAADGVHVAAKARPLH